MRVLVLNAGSSSLKLSIIDRGSEDRRSCLQADGAPMRDASPTATRASRDAIQEVPEATSRHIDAVGHRVVHGGTRFQAATIIDDAVEAESPRWPGSHLCTIGSPWRRSAEHADGCETCRRWPRSTRPSTRRCPSP